MPSITPKTEINNSIAQGSAAPAKTLVANTKSIKDVIHMAGGASTDKPTLTEVPKEVISGQNNTSVVPADTEAKEETKSVTLSPQLTALARKEQAFRKQQEAFKAKEQEFKAAKEAFETKQAENAKIVALKDRLATKDYSVLDELGVSYEEWTNHLLNKGEPQNQESQALKKLEDEIKAIKTQQEESDKKQKDAVSKQYEATVNQYRKEITSLVQQDPAFESVKELKAEEHVLQHILSTFEEDGEVLSVEDAAREVEELLVEEALSMAKLKKVQQKLQPVQETKEKTLPPPQQKTIKTLTNQVAPVQQKSYKQSQHLSYSERVQLAVAKAQGNR